MNVKNFISYSLSELINNIKLALLSVPYKNKNKITCINKVLKKK